MGQHNMNYKIRYQICCESRKADDHGRRSCCCWCEKHSTNSVSMGSVLVLLPHQCKLSLIIRKIVYAQNARELIKYKKNVLFGYSLAQRFQHMELAAAACWLIEWCNRWIQQVPHNFSIQIKSYKFRVIQIFIQKLFERASDVIRADICMIL